MGERSWSLCGSEHTPQSLTEGSFVLFNGLREEKVTTRGKPKLDPAHTAKRRPEPYKATSQDAKVSNINHLQAHFRTASCSFFSQA